MGKVGSATCIVCGREFPKDQMDAIFIGRTRYRCRECIADGDKQVMARVCDSHSRGFIKKLRERDEWRY